VLFCSGIAVFCWRQTCLHVPVAQNMYNIMSLGVFAKLLKATVIFVMSVGRSVYPSIFPSICSSVLPHGTSRLPVDIFSWNLTFEYFSKIRRKNSISLKSYKANEYFKWRPLYIYVINFSEFFLEREILQT